MLNAQFSILNVQVRKKAMSLVSVLETEWSRLNARLRPNNFPTDGLIHTYKIKKKYSHSIIMKEAFLRASFEVFERQ